MNKIGVITDIKNNDAIVMIAQTASCGNCGCSGKTRKDGEMCDDDKKFVKVNNSINGEVGDPVNIEFKTSKMLKTSIMLYFIPMLLFVIGIFVGNTLKKGDIISFGSGVLFMIISFVILSFIDKKKNKEELITISEFKGY